MVKAGKYWKPRAEEKIGIPLGPTMRKDGTTAGIDMSYQMTLPRREVVTFKIMWAAFKKAVPEHWWSFAEEDPYGGVIIDKNGASLSSLEFCYSLYRIHEHLIDYTRFLEIGAGYGGMARMLLRRGVRLVTIVDLPPMLRIQRHYLNNIASWKGHVSFATEIPDAQFDFAMNTRSFCEMDLSEVNAYFARLDEVLVPGGRFYSVNHDECKNKFVDWRVPRGWKLVDERIYPLPWKTGAKFAWKERTWEKG